MAKYRINELKAAAANFLQYLIETERMHIQDKEELKSIYKEYIIRHEDRKIPFSQVIFGLKAAGRAEVSQDGIHLKKFSRKTVSLPDQYIAIKKDRIQQAQHAQASADGSSTGGQPQRFTERMKQRAEFISDKNGISISSECDLSDGRIRFHLPLGEPKTFPIIIKNKSSESVSFTHYKVLRRMRVFSFKDEYNWSLNKPMKLAPGDEYEIQVYSCTVHYGYFPTTLVFEFRSESNSQCFQIGRFLSAVSNSKLAERLGPTSKYIPFQIKFQKPIERIEDDGFPPESSLNYELEREVPLDDFTPPNNLRSSIRKGLFVNCGSTKSFSSVGTDHRDLLASSLAFGNYNKKFHLLMHLEEIQMELDIRRYDQHDQLMEKDPRDKRFLILNVPGVAENRPSVLRGDHLFVTLSKERGKHGIISHKGYVHGVELERVKLGFSQNLLNRFINGLCFDVSFTFNRLPLKIQHRAVDLAKDRNLSKILFPEASFGISITDSQKLTLYDRILENNPEQYTAVKQILSGISRPAPYLIFGPPGTGKTVTLVESIKQVVKHIPNCHVLACAPSNSASDLLCERLMKHLDQRQIYRIIASSRDIRTVPENIKPCCNWNKDKDSFVYPSKYDLKNYKVIVTTLVTAGRLASANFSTGHFSHVFIDEAGHAVEPECVTAIAGILDVMDPANNEYGGQLVLAGDPKQLGPILRSPVAIEHGLAISLLERLMTQNDLYKKVDDCYNPKFVTKLLRNYRSHPSILKIPNELFYDNELQVAANEMITKSYCNWEKLPQKGFPVIFHGVLGKDEQEGNSPSFFNVNEIEELFTYLKALFETQGRKTLAKITPKEIGIISPYRKQVEKIRQAIKSELDAVPDIKELKVGSVEEFQGQERKVILISTVRSSSDYVTFDEKYSLGFLKNPKRFNVAVTRAKALLILIGNPRILSKDPNWSKFLKYCSDNGGYTGFPLKDALDDGDIADLLADLDINDPPPGQETGESFIQQQAEPNWRHEH
ncbi:putative helicase MOV-10 isoform X1 [Xenopus laevis]|uniref:RNA helicase n=1 Tax=Xenopus laevis TaxID=8355 RepID=A0A8J1M8M9_XENLA|nr:putative helicase MOV-10 isoform X1 [Xenopus laevis]